MKVVDRTQYMKPHEHLYGVSYHHQVYEEDYEVLYKLDHKRRRRSRGNAYALMLSHGWWWDSLSRKFVKRRRYRFG